MYVYQPNMASRSKASESKSLIRKTVVRKKYPDRDENKIPSKLYNDSGESNNNESNVGKFIISPDGPEVSQPGNIKSLIDTFNTKSVAVVDKPSIVITNEQGRKGDECSKRLNVTEQRQFLVSKMDKQVEKCFDFNMQHKQLRDGMVGKSKESFHPKIAPKPGSKPIPNVNKFTPKIAPKPSMVNSQSSKCHNHELEKPETSLKGIPSLQRSERFESMKSDDSGFCSISSGRDSDRRMMMRKSMCSSIEDLYQATEEVEEFTGKEGEILTKYMKTGQGTFEEFCEQSSETGGKNPKTMYFRMKSGTKVKLHHGYVLPDKSPEVYENTGTKLCRNKSDKSTFEEMHEQIKRQTLERDDDVYYNDESGDTAVIGNNEENLYEPVAFKSRHRMSRKSSSSMSKGSEDDDFDDDDDEWYDWSDFDESDDGEFPEDNNETDLATQTRRKDKLYCIAEELLSTEVTYVKKLELLAEAKLRTESIVKDSSKKLFPYIDGIFKIHKEDFLPKLQKRIKNWEEDNEIGDIMKGFAPFLKMYTDYVKNFKNLTGLVRAWMEKSAEFAKVVQSVCEEFAKKNSVIKLDIEDHMLEPVQRVPRYKLLLRDYLKHLPSEGSDIERTNVQDAIKLVSEAAEHFEFTMTQKTEFGDLMDLDKQIDGPMSLICANRKLAKQGLVKKYCVRTDKVKQRYLFLFNDLLMVCKESSIPGVTKYKARQCLHTEGMQILEGSTLDIPNTFLVKTKQKSVEFVADSETDKMEWQKALWKTVGENVREKLNKKNNFSDKIVKAAIANLSEVSDNKLGKIAPVWVKNKEVTMCMICGQDFTHFLRRHHCRACGNVICRKCSSHELALEYDDFREHRVCEECYAIITKKPNTLKMTNKLRKRSKELCTKYGFLHASSNEGRTWQKRYCEIHEGGMFYIYKASQDLKPFMCMDLGLCSLSTQYYNERTPMVLCVVNKGFSHLLKTEEEAALIRWQEAFNSAIKEAVNTRFIEDSVSQNIDFPITPPCDDDNPQDQNIQDNQPVFDDSKPTAEEISQQNEPCKSKMHNKINLRMVQEDSMNISMDAEFFDEFDNDSNEEEPNEYNHLKSCNKDGAIVINESTA